MRCSSDTILEKQEYESITGNRLRLKRVGVDGNGERERGGYERKLRAEESRYFSPSKYIKIEVLSTRTISQLRYKKKNFIIFFILFRLGCHRTRCYAAYLLRSMVFLVFHPTSTIIKLNVLLICILLYSMHFAHYVVTLILCTSLFYT